MNMGPKLALIGMSALVLFAWISISLEQGAPASRAAEPESRSILREAPVAPPELLTPARPAVGVADERVAVEPSVVDLETLWADKYRDTQGLHMLRAGQELHLQVIARLKEAHDVGPVELEQPLAKWLAVGTLSPSRKRAPVVPDEKDEPELCALYREANWLLEEGTLKLRKESTAAFSDLASRPAFVR